MKNLFKRTINFSILNKNESNSINHLEIEKVSFRRLISSIQENDWDDFVQFLYKLIFYYLYKIHY